MTLFPHHILKKNAEGKLTSIFLPVRKNSQLQNRPAKEQEKYSEQKKWITVNKNYFCLLLVCLLSTDFAIAQKPRLSFKNLTSTQGLSQTSVYCILQDHKGFMWFGTQDGLNKYDGYKFIIYKNKTQDSLSISGNYIRVLYEDKEKNLWIGTLSGLNLYDRKNDIFIQFKNDINDPQTLSHNEVTSIHEDREGNLWIGTVAGLNLFDKKNKTFTYYKHDPKNPNSLSDSFVYSVYEDRKGNLWIGTYAGGLNLFDREAQTFKSYSLPKDPTKAIPSVTLILEDKKGNLWLGTTEAGLNLFDRDKKTFTQFVHDRKNPNSLGRNVIYSIFEDSKGNLWIGTMNSGLNLFNREQGTFTHYVHDESDNNSLSNNTPSAIYEDRSGTLWVGVHRGGVNYCNPQQQKFTTYQFQPNTNSISSNNIRAIIEDQHGRIWIGTNGGGLNLFDRKKNTFTHFRNDPKDAGSISSDEVLTVLVDSYNNVWAGTFGGGLNRLDKTRNRFTRFLSHPKDTSINLPNIWYILEDNQSQLWIGDYDYGFYLVDLKRHYIYKRPYPSISKINLTSDDIRFMYKDSSNNLWIATFRGGLNLYDPTTDRIVRYLHDELDPKSISSDEILSIFEDHKKRLWIGTRLGLNLFDRENKSFKVYKQEDGLTSEVIQSITEDDNGNLWLGTLMGLSKFNPEEGKFKNFTEADGLQGNEFSRNACLKASDGVLFFGGINGFNTFYPDQIKDNPYVPPVYITNFQIFNKPVGIGKGYPLKTHINEATEIILPYETSVFSFEFAALNFIIPEKNQYAYKLEGFDREWNYVNDQRTATYTNLDPGIYYFNVKASNNDGVWNEKGTTIKIVITPPFWKTWWFISLLVLGLVTGLITFYRIRVGDIKKQKEVLEKVVQQRTEEIATQNEQLIEQQEELEAQRNSLAEQNKTIESKNILLENQQHHLESLVEERTLELLKSNMELQDKNQRFEQYGFMTSHNFRGPVATLLGLCNLFNKTEMADPENLVLMEKIEETTQKIDEMIRDLSALLNQETHLEKLFEKVNLEETIENVKGLLSHEIDQSNAVITSDFSEVTAVKAVPAYIVSIFYNLINNSIKFKKEQELPKIEIRSILDDDGIFITFQDNGGGIDLKKHAGSIFHPFKRFHNNIPGKGLGLYLVKTQLKAMNADIQIESQMEKGTTFKLIFKK